MNHLLLRSEALSESGEFEVIGERAEHLRRVLKVEVGQQIRAARVNHETGVAEITRILPHALIGKYHPGPPVPRPKDKTLLLAVPRPKVLSRCIQHAVALGYQRILLVRANRVDKGHLDSNKLTAERLEADAFTGLEQARRVHLPEFVIYRRFKPFVEDVLETQLTGLVRYVAHPGAPVPTAQLQRSSQNFCLAIGPEGGWVDFEVQLLERCGFVGVSAGASPLRVESALSYLSGQLDLVHGQPCD
jgi:16S rRNA (uracil1498-N3)-methyltransferase